MKSLGLTWIENTSKLSATGSTKSLPGVTMWDPAGDHTLQHYGATGNPLDKAASTCSHRSYFRLGWGIATSHRATLELARSKMDGVRITPVRVQSLQPRV